MLLGLALGFAACGATGPARAQPARAGTRAAQAASAGGGGEPTGRAIAALEPARCLEVLRSEGIAFRTYDGEHADAMRTAVVLEGPVAGIRIEHAGGSEVHSLLDCRLVVALLRWAPALRAADVVRIEHFSAFRPGARVRGSGSKSAHAAGLAIDAGRFHLEDGSVLDVEEAWVNDEHGDEPCPAREDETPQDNAVLRSLVCRAVAEDLFQVVITPHHDDAHDNHVHLELVPEVEWSYVR